MAKSCPTAGKSAVQAIWAAIEDVSGELQKPTAADYILPRGNATMNQTPTQTASEELSESLNVIDQFQDAVEAGEATIPMYLRLASDGGKMQGHALFLAAMGNVQESDTVTAALSAQADAAATTLSIDTIAGGFLPPAGIVSVDTETIRYTGRTITDGVVTALTGCVRGYNGTVAAAHEADAVVTLKSRVYSQDICRNTVSLWMKDDHTVFFASGGVVTATEIAFSNSSGQNVDFTVQFRKMGWVGRSFLAEAPTGQTLKVVDSKGNPAADAYSVGGYIKNTTKGLDNNSAGYRITGVDTTAGTITVEGTIGTFAEDDQIDPWTPASEAVDTVVESRRAKILIDGQTGRIREGSLTLNTPTEFLQEIGDEYPGESVDTQRELSITMNAYFRADNAPEIGKGYNGYEVPVLVRMGLDGGKVLAVAMERVKLSMPEVGTDGAAYTLDRNGAILGTKGEDALYIIQE